MTVVHQATLPISGMIRTPETTGNAIRFNGVGVASVADVLQIDLGIKLAVGGSLNMSGMMDCCGATDVGKKRSANEDQFLVSDVSKSMRVHQTSLALDHQTRLFGDTKGKLLLVADGMGGHEAGERASQLVIDAIVDYVLNRLSWYMFDSCLKDSEFEEQLKQALIECQRRIDREVSAIPQRRGMGSTLTMAYIVWPRMFLVHAGDSRCYLLRDGELQQLTRDHTLADLASSVQRGKQGTAVQEDDDANEGDRPMANVLWNVIGGDARVPHPDAIALDLQLGDTLLLCTDGLNKHLTRRQIREILSDEKSTEVICQNLIDGANAAGGSDNVTVIVSRFEDRVADAAVLEEVELALDDPNRDTVDFVKPKFSIPNISSQSPR